MTKMLYGALVHGRRSGPDASATVEARTVAGAAPFVMLAAVHGDLATPALEAIKSSLAKVARADERAAAHLAAAAPPPPYASGVAVVLLDGARAFVAATGDACCYLERGGRLEAIAPGAYDLVAGEAILAASHAGPTAGRAFFDADVPAAEDDAFSNSRLDGALETALARGGDAFIAVAAARASS
jgi:hypothetical protein